MHYQKEQKELEELEEHFAKVSPPGRAGSVIAPEAAQSGFQRHAMEIRET